MLRETMVYNSNVLDKGKFKGGECSDSNLIKLRVACEPDVNKINLVLLAYKYIYAGIILGIDYIHPVTMSKRLQKTTQKQYEELLRFVMGNKIIITGKTKPLEAKKINMLWEQFASQINSKGYGPSKTANQWRTVFTEWKTNTKRKSRQIQIALTQTGGGPPINKKLTDLEEQLLQLLSKIHLGDTQIQETIIENIGESEPDDATEISVIKENFNSSEVDVGIIQDHNYLDLTSDLTETVVLPTIEDQTHILSVEGTSKDTPRKNKIKAKPQRLGQTPSQARHDSRYSNMILKSACEQFAEGQKLNIENKKLEFENLKILNETLLSMTQVFREHNELENTRNEIEKEKLKVEAMKAKIQYIQIFGDIQGYDELFLDNSENMQF